MFRGSIRLILFLSCLYLVESSLIPYPWEQYEYKGRKYYFNKITGESQWDPPITTSDSINPTTSAEQSKADNSANLYNIYRRPVRRHTIIGNRSISAITHNQQNILNNNTINDSTTSIQGSNASAQASSKQFTDRIQNDSLDQESSSSSNMYRSNNTTDQYEFENSYDDYETYMYDNDDDGSESYSSHDDDRANQEVFSEDSKRITGTSESSTDNNRYWTNTTQYNDHDTNYESSDSSIVNSNTNTPSLSMTAFDPEYYQELVDSLETQVETLEEKLDTLNMEKSTLQRKLTKQLKDYKIIRKKLETLKDERQSLTTTVSLRDQLIKKHEKEMKKHHNIVKKLEQKLTQTQEKYKKQESTYKKRVAIGASNKVFGKNIQETQPNTSDNSMNENRSNGNVIAMDGNITLYLNRVIEDKNAIIVELWQFIDELKEDESTQEKKIKDMKNSISQYESLRQRTEAALMAKATNEHLLAAFTRLLANQIDELQQRNQELQSEISYLTQQQYQLNHNYTVQITSIKGNITVEKQRYEERIQFLDNENKELSQRLIETQHALVTAEASLKAKQYLSTDIINQIRKFWNNCREATITIYRSVKERILKAINKIFNR